MALKIGVILDTASGVPQAVKDTQAAIDKLKATVDKNPIQLPFKINEKTFSTVDKTIRSASTSAKELKAAIAAVTAEMRKLEGGEKSAYSLDNLRNTLKYLQLMLSGSTDAYANYYAQQGKFNEKQREIVNQRTMMSNAEVQILQEEANSLEVLAAQIQAAQSQLQTMPGGPAFAKASTKEEIADYEKMATTLAKLKAEYDAANAAIEEMNALIAMGDGTVKRNEITIKSMQSTLAALKAGMESINLSTEENVNRFYKLGQMTQKVAAAMREYQLEFTRATTAQGSLDRLNGELSAINAEWAAMSKSERESSDRATALLENYRRITGELANEALSLSQVVAKEKEREAHQQKLEGMTAKRAAQIKYEDAILSHEAKTLTMLNEQIRILSSRKMKLNVDSQEFADIKKQIANLETLKKEYEATEAETAKLKKETAELNTVIDRSSITINSMQQLMSALKTAMDNINLSTSEGRAQFVKYGQVVQELSAMMQAYQKAVLHVTTASGSLNRLNGELSAINAEWAAMSKSERESSSRAASLVGRYKKLTSELENEALTLSQIVAKEKEREEHQRRLQSMTNKRKAQLKYEEAILKNEAKTMKMLNEQIRILTNRRSKMNIGTDEFAQATNQINTLNARLNELNGSVEKTGTKSKKNLREINSELNISASYVGRLLIRLGLYSGIFAAFRAVKTIRDVTAEFEMQRVALGGIIQDTYKAEQLFQQIKAAAVKSPFEIKDLVSYTKQLSAYRIETDKLFDVTMRLADVSAGLGVDMSRLILAYGQVRAASVLRGQELRQFTEAGIPLVELLADKFSQLRGELVSTGEVFDLISKRQVPFEMIAEIFEDMTEKGGMFYKMQEKQSETLKGQWMNLKDAVSIMYDEIGNTSSVNNAMLSIIGTLKEMAQNWRNIAVSIASFSVAAGAIKATSLAVKVLTVDTKLLDKATQRAEYSRRVADAGHKAYAVRLRLSARYMTQAANATNFYRRMMLRLRAALAAVNPTMLAISAAALAFAAIANHIIKAVKAAREFRKAMEEINTETNTRIERSVYNFKKLADIVTSSNSSLKERQDALGELNRTYSEYLPKLTEEQLLVSKQNEGYKSLVASIREKIKLQGIEQKISKAQEMYGGQMSGAKDVITRRLRAEGISTEDIIAFWREVEQEMENGVEFTINNVLDIAEKAGGDDLRKKIIGALFVPGQSSLALFKPYIKAIETYNDAFKKLNKTVEELNDEMSATGIGGKLGTMYKDMITDVFAKMPNAINAEDTNKQIKEKVNAFMGYIEAAFKESKVDLPKDIAKGEYIDFSKLFGALDPTKNSQLIRAITAVQKEYQKIVPSTNLARMSKDVFTKMAEDAGASLDKMRSYFKSDEQSVEDWVKEVKGGLDDARASVQRYTAELADTEKAGGDTEGIEKEKTAAEALAKALENAYEWAKKYTIEKEKSGGKGSDPELARIKEEVSLIEKMYDKYKEYLKLMDSASARNKVTEMFKDTITGLQFKPQEFSPSEIASIIRQYQKALGGATSQRQQYGLELGFKAENVDWSTFKENLTAELERLKKDIAHTEAAKNFFNDMLAQTGDAAIARSITVSVYGEVGDGLADSMIEQVEKTFAGLDVSSAIDKGLGRIDYNKLRGFIPQLSKDMRGAAEEIVSNGERANAEWLKDIMKTYEKAKTLEERLTIVRTREAQKRSEIQSRVSDEGERESLTAASYEHEKKEVAEIQAEFLKNSELWSKTFENIEKVGTQSIGLLIDRLKAFIDLYGSSLDPTDLKTLVQELDKLQDAQAERNPWQGLKEGFTEAIAGIKEYKAALEDVNNLTADEKAQHDNYLQLSDALTSQIAAEKDKLNQMDVTDPGYEEQAMKVRSLEGRLKSLTATYNKVEDAENGVAQGSNKFKAGLSKINSAVGGISTALSSFKNAFDQITGLLELPEDSDAAVAIQGISDAFGVLIGILGAVAAVLTVIQILADSVMAALWPLLVIAAALAAIIAVFKIVTNLKAKHLQEQIDALQEKVDELEESFERLENQMEKTFGSDYIDNYTKRVEALRAEVEAYTKMAELERQKGKKSDSEKVDDYLKSAKEAQDQIVEMQQEVAERMTGTDLASAAKEFAESWIEAYVSFSSTSAAMKEKFEEMVQNMVVQSMAAKLIQNILSPIFDQIDEMAKSGGELTAAEIAAISGQIPGKIGEINAALNGMMAQLAEAGINLRAGTSDLKGVSRDIASASEESILGLAAGINTQNFYISGIYSSVNQILALLQGGPVNAATAATAGTNAGTGEYLSYLPNIAQNTADMVAECRAAAAECRATNELLNKVIKPRGSSTTHVVMTNV